jgi:osmotically-inducible protein OsmY
MPDQTSSHGREERGSTDDFGNRWGYNGDNAAWDRATEAGAQDASEADQHIRQEIGSRLGQHAINASAIEVEVREGTVTLRGMVDSQQSKHIAEETIRAVTGVRDVRNELEVQL